MKPLSLALRGLNGRFEEGIKLDLRGVSGLVAITGPNGAGKTTLMESLLPAALFRSLPSRRRLLSAACPGPMVLDLTLEHAGSTWRLVHQVDPAGRGRSDAVLFEGETPITGGRLTDFDQAVAARFPPEDVVLASVFAAQRGIGSFGTLDPGARRDLLARLLGLEEIQGLADRARGGRKVVDARGATLREAYERAETRRREVRALELDLEVYRRDVAAGDTALDLAAAAEAEQAIAVAGLEARAGELERIAADRKERRQRLGDQIARARREVEDAKRGLAEVVDAPARVKRLRERVALLEGLTAERTALREKHAKCKADLEVLRARIAAGEAAVRRNEMIATRRRGLEARVEELKDAPVRLETARIDLARARGDLATAQAALPSTPLAPCSANAGAVAVLENQIKRAEEARALIGRVPCEGGPIVIVEDGELRVEDEGIVSGGSCELLRGSRTLVEQLPAMRSNLDTMNQEITAWTAAFADRQVLQAASSAARAEVDRAALEEREAAGREERRAVYGADLAGIPDLEEVPDLGALEVERSHVEIELAAALQEGTARAAEIASLGAPGEELERAQRDEGAVAGARAAVVRSGERLLELQGDLEALEATWAPISTTEDQEIGALAAARRTLEFLRGSLREKRASAEQARSALGRLEGRIAGYGDVDLELERARDQLSRIDVARAGWVLLERGLGREGVQALEIDAAGPALGQLTTDLLTEIVGPRWGVQLRTIREAEGAKKAREVCELVISDAERGGAERTIDALSVGEQVVVEEALKLAIAVFNSRRTGIRWGALFRDETDGSLSAEVAERYPAMLRAAMAAGGFDVVFFVTHRPEVADQADARIRVGADGSVSMEVS